ncbi:HAD family hydrolase [Mycetocola zhujimingii]|uniref:HAD family hydrolase n=1 Tax=Mycetocola zhujimingii TaxID=2079792 RepID=UPI000D34B089|nr:HAD-IA family hydrolase [Mycetocola zhujimingii]AWB85741.1 HAD family hydrolase [Mycetocola zhujimingii]
MSTPSVVLFDLDDTLLDHRGAVSRGILRHVDLSPGHLVVDDRDAAVTLWHSLEEQHYHRYLSGELTFAGQRRARARDFAAAHGVSLGDAEADTWFDTYFDSYRTSWQLFDDALPCLDRLQDAGTRVGIITNGEPDHQQLKLDRIGLADRFEHVVASGAVGFAKPDPRIFHEACRLFGVAPSDAAYVGDRLETDAIGAAHAGLTGVWLNRFGENVVAGALGHGTPVGTSALAAAREAAAAAGVRIITSLDEL